MELTKKMIDKIFAEATDQAEYMNELYKIAVPDWNQVVHINKFPRVSKTTNLYIFDKTLSFDREHHPDVLAMGAWLNAGFSTDETLPDWQVCVEPGDVEYKAESKEAV